MTTALCPETDKRTAILRIGPKVRSTLLYIEGTRPHMPTGRLCLGIVDSDSWTKGRVNTLNTILQRLGVAAKFFLVEAKR